MAEEAGETEGLKTRIKALAEARDQAKIEAAELRARLATTEGELAPLRAAAATYDTERAAWSAERTYLEVGITDPEAREIAGILHGRIPEAERPALDVWLRGVRADPTTAPRALQPYLGAPAAPVPVTAAPVAAPGHARQVTPARVEASPAAGVATSPEAIRAAIQRGRQTGDWSTYETLRAQVVAERGPR